MLFTVYILVIKINADIMIKNTLKNTRMDNQW